MHGATLYYITWNHPKSTGKWEMTGYIKLNQTPTYAQAVTRLHEARAERPDRKFRLMRSVTYTEVIDV